MLNPAELKALDFRIGRNADRLIAKAQRTVYTAKVGKLGRPEASFSNCVLPEMVDVRMSGEDWPLWVDDVLAGITRLDWYAQDEDQVPLSMGKLLKIFCSLDIISTSHVSQLLQLGERQARRYFKAAQLAHPKLIDGYCDDTVHSIRYPETFIYYGRLQ
jgi:hypothetical protein